MNCTPFTKGLAGWIIYRHAEWATIAEDRAVVINHFNRSKQT
jgi:hypothetical protein